MKRKWLLLSGALAYIATIAASDKASSLQEGIELRRISAYFKEKNYPAVKAQSHNFLTKYPHSHSADALYAMLGDIAFVEGDFPAALASYDQIKKREVHAKTEFRRIHCLHRLSQFDALITATQSFLKNGEILEGQRPTLRLQLANALFQKALLSEEGENKKKILLQAKEHYLSLAPTAHAHAALLPLAQIHTLLKDYAQAVKMYRFLIEKEPQSKEEYLLQIMQLQCRYDHPSAIETCETIFNLSGPAAPRAAYNQLCLLFQEKRFRDLAHFQEKALGMLSLEHRSLAHYFIGRSLYHIGDHKTAIAHLDAFLKAKNGENAQVKTTLLTLLDCAKQIDDSALFEKTLMELKTAFPKEEETIRALIMHAEFCSSKGGNVSLAIENLKQLLENADAPQREDILYQYALLCAQDQKWLDCASSFESFIKNYAAHPQQNAAWRHLIHARLNCMKEATQETAFVAKEELATTLQRALNKEALLSPEEKRKMRLFCAKLLLEINKEQRAIEELMTYEADYPGDPERGQIHVLIALAHLQSSGDRDLFIHYAEKALAIQPDLSDAQKLHLTLYNTYLSEAEKRGEEEKREMLLKAADHLYYALDHAQKKENSLWLAQFYYNHFKTASALQAAFFLERSIDVFEKIVKGALSEDKLEREGEMLKLAELYGAKQELPKKIALLKNLTEEYVQHPQNAWKYQRLTQFELASAYKEQKQYEKAIETYSYLISSSAPAPSYFATAAQLEKALLQFSLLPAEKKKAGETEVQAVCDELKDVEIKRKLFSEPCHLEAALSYVDITAELSPIQEQLERRLVLLRQMKESFSSSEDPLVKDYLSAKEEFGREYALYQHYMTLIEADLCVLEARLAYKQDEKEKGFALKQKAEEYLHQLPSDISQERLKERVERSKEGLKQWL